MNTQNQLTTTDGPAGSLALDPRSALYDYLDWLLYPDGTCTHKGRAVAWYKDQRTGKPWIPAKRKTFVSLVKGMERDGDISYLPNGRDQRRPAPDSSST